MDHVVGWMKEVIGFLLNKIDAQEIDRDLFVAKITSLVESPFGLSRYRSLKRSDFTDDITTINPNELLMGGGGAQDLGDPNQNQDQNAAAALNLQNMI
mmetsp:Transcript_2381/g.1711  ORF Transcript_2381/g.1711 Transcript_2381/m.1711 type:complete len:98 (+) Transcript_2381:1714-2007(+)